MLERSKMASLTIDADLQGREDPALQVMKQILSHIHRTKALSVRGPITAMNEVFVGAIISAPILQSLILARHTSLYSDGEYRLPKPMLTGDTPSLRRVELVGWIAPWSSPFLLSGLTHLKIHQPCASTRSTMAEIVTALETMPALISLDLENALPAVPDSVVAIPVPERIVGLTCLSSIAITAKVSECAQLLKCLSLSSSISVILVCDATLSTGHDFSSILDVLSHHGSTNTRAHGEPRIRSLHVDGSCGTLTVCGWTCLPTKKKKRLSYNYNRLKHIKLDLRWPNYTIQTTEVVAMAVCRALPLDWLQFLVLGVNPSAQHEWSAIFGNLSKLQTLHVRCLSANGIDSISAILQRQNQALGSHSITFPMLRNLFVEAVSFKKDNKPPTSHNLLDCLIMRYEQHAEVQALVFSKCSGLFKKDVGLLREVVIDVRWDGYEARDYSSSNFSTDTD